MSTKSRIEKGIEWLDENGPREWWCLVNLNTLDMRDGDYCILGQVYRERYENTKIGKPAYSSYGSGYDYAIRNDFRSYDPYEYGFDDTTGAYWWRVEITKRQQESAGLVNTVETSTKQMPNENDIVRVTLEGPAREIYSGRSFALGNRNKNYIFPDAEHVKSIEIIEPAKPDFWPLRSGDTFRSNKGPWNEPVRVVLDRQVYTADGLPAYGLSAYEPEDVLELLYRPETND